MGCESVAGLHVPHNIKFASTYLSTRVEKVAGGGWRVAGGFLAVCAAYPTICLTRKAFACLNGQAKLSAPNTLYELSSNDNFSEKL